MADILTETGIAILNPLQTIGLKIIDFLPSLIGAIIVLIIGYIVGWLIGHLVKVILDKSGLDKLMRKGALTKEVGHVNIPSITGEIVKWLIVIVFLQQAVALVKLGELSDMLSAFVGWLPSLIVAVIILLVGLAVAHYLGVKVEEHSKQKGIKISIKLVKAAIVIMVLIVALKQIGVQVGLLENTFLILIGALGIGLAVALGIGLGSAMKRHSEDIVQEIRKNF